MTLKVHHLALAALLAGQPVIALAEQVRVLASQPITHGLGHALLAGTDVQLERAAPANLPASRQIAYFAGRGAPALRKNADQADAVIALRSLWPEDPLYPMARRSNIRIVEIDAARPVDGALPGVALQAGGPAEGALGAYPWLVVNNLGRMADVTAADLARLAPQAKPKIEENLAALKKRLLALNARSEAELANADNLSVVSLSGRLDYLIGGLNLERVETDSRDDREWTPEALAQLTATLRENDVAVVLHHRQPGKPVQDAVAAAGVPLRVLETDPQDPVAGLEDSIEQVIQALAGAQR